MNARAPHRDAGFTLPELLITITIAGIVLGALSMALITFLKSEPEVTARLDRTLGLQHLVNYLPADVASAQSISTATGGCGSLGDPVLDLIWRESFDGVSRSWNVTYRFDDDASPGPELIRSACGDGDTWSSVVATGLDSVNVDVSGGEVRMSLERRGVERVLAASSRNVATPGGAP